MEIVGQGGGRRRADTRQGQQHSHAIPGPLNHGYSAMYGCQALILQNIKKFFDFSLFS